jgi:hypothetical protein
MRLVCACLLATLPAGPLAGARTEAVSWGQPGVSIDQYSTDAVTCGRLGYYMDASDTEAAHVFRDATGQLQANEANLAALPPSQLLNAVVMSAHIVEGTRPGERIKAVGALMQAKVDDCLRSRGYIRFRLTTDQRKYLGHLHIGSPERRLYLYQLATDPQVLSSQVK